MIFKQILRRTRLIWQRDKCRAERLLSSQEDLCSIHLVRMVMVPACEMIHGVVFFVQCNYLRKGIDMPVPYRFIGILYTYSIRIKMNE